MLKLMNVSKSYGNLKAVEDISFQLQAGEMLALLGGNGAGKSTTFKMILDVFKPDSGTILFEGKQVDLKKGQEIGYLAEERSLLLSFTIYDQLKFFASLKKMNSKEIDLAIDYWLDYFSILEYKNNKIKALSKGNQQKVQFISAILHSPKLLILDEPFSGMDPYNVELFSNAINLLQSKGTAIVFSSHRLDYVQNFATNILVLVKGKTMIQGNVDEIRKSQGNLYVHVAGNFSQSDLEAISEIVEIKVFKNHYECLILKDEDTQVIFNALRSFNISLFMTKLPSLEQIVLKQLGDAYGV